MPTDNENPEAAKQTLAFWQKKTNCTLNTEDARQIMENLTGFFGVLADWAEAEKKCNQSVSVKKQPQMPPKPQA